MDRSFVCSSVRSPDLNPVEKYWAWLRKALVAMDLRDLHSGKPALNKEAYKARAQRLVKTKKSQTVAKNCATNFKKACRAVSLSGGAASR